MTSGTTTTKHKVPRSGRRKFSSALIALLALLGVLGALAVPYTSAYKDQRYRGRSLAALLTEQTTHTNDPVYIYWLGRRLCDTGNFDQALGVLERGVSLDPSAPRLREQWTRAQLATGKISLAYGQLTEFVATHPTLAAAHYLLGTFHYTQKSTEAARSSLEKATKLEPNYPQALSLLANVQIQLGENTQALSTLRRALALRPRAALDHLQLATLLVTAAPQEARSAFLKALTLAPENALCHEKYAAFLLQSGETASAEPQLRQALALAPESPMAHLLLGRCLVLENKPDAALPELEKAAQLAEGDPVAARELRSVHQHLGHTAEASRWTAEAQRRQQRVTQRTSLENELRVHPKNREAHLQMAALLASVGAVNDCIRELAIAHQERPDSPNTLTKAAVLLTQASKAKLAVPLALQATQLAPNNPRAQEALGDAQLALSRLHEASLAYFIAAGGDAKRFAPFEKRINETKSKLALHPTPVLLLYKKALEASTPQESEQELERALKVDPEHTASLRLLLQLQVQRGDDAAAKKTGQHLLSLVPNEGIGSVLLAIVLLKTSGPAVPEVLAQAEQLFSQAALDPSAAPILPFGYGLMALQRKDPKAAQAFFQQAISLGGPDSTVARLAQEQLSRLTPKESQNL
jgi:tetratricopeptide (TPR) repeat protein